MRINRTILLLFVPLLHLGCKKKSTDCEKSGYVTCGYCNEDALTSNNPNAGRCIYCPTGTTCSTSDPCDPNLQCVPIVPPDPPNTVTHNLRHDVEQRSLVLYQGTAEDTCREYYGPYPYQYIDYTTIGIYLMLNASINFYVLSVYDDAHCEGRGEIVNVGKVKGLGEVSGLPMGGWSREAAAQPGYGYIIRYKKAQNLDDPHYVYSYARVYVESYLTSATTGGILGVKVKYENPYVPR